MARVTVRLTPRAGRDAIDGWDGEILRVRVAAAPTGGRANDALIRILAKALRVAPSTIVLVSGAGSRTKTVDIANHTMQELLEMLEP